MSGRVSGRLVLPSLLAASLAVGCRVPEAPPIILISIDTLRSDHLPCYGYRGVETPAIDSLCRDAIRFERAYSHAPLTAPSHASILSGVLPTLHGLRDNVGYSYDAARLPHLPRLLGARGYRSGAAISAFVLRSELGFGADFEIYEDRIQTRAARGLSGIQRRGDETLAAISPWLRSVEASGAPFFLFLHLYEPHAPYAPDERLASRYAANLYDGEIATVDRVIGQLLTQLRTGGVYDRAAILLLSDHGEGLGEHGEEGHGVFLYRQTLQVPLLLKFPRGRYAGSSVAAAVPLADVHATVLDLAGVTPRDESRSLLRLLPGGGPDREIYSETFTPRLHFGWSATSLISGSHHYIHGPDPETLDLAADPEEERNVAGRERRRRVALATRLSEIQVPLGAAAPVDEETRKQLAALGYIGSAAVEPDARLPDPKRMIGTLAFLHQGLEAFHRQDFELAAERLRSAVDANPRMTDAWSYLGRAYQRLGQARPALQALERAIEMTGGEPESVLAAASILVSEDRTAEAVVLLEREHRRSPRDARLLFLLGRLLLVNGEIDAADRAAQRGLVEHPTSADAHYQAGAVAMARQDRRGAEAALRRALELDPEHPAALSDLAVLLAADGRFGDALELARGSSGSVRRMRMPEGCSIDSSRGSPHRRVAEISAKHGAIGRRRRAGHLPEALGEVTVAVEAEDCQSEVRQVHSGSDSRRSSAVKVRLLRRY